MIHIESILVPVDFSEPSGKAVKYGLALALQFKSTLILAHIVPDYHTLDYSFPPQSFELDKDAYERPRQQMAELIPAEFRDKISTETIVKAGDIQDEILRVVEGKNVDLVVMGSHGRRQFERFLLGSVTERMLRKLPIPILTVSHLDPAKEGQGAQLPELKRILYATDLSEESAAGLGFAVRLTRGLGASLTVVHAMDMVEQVLVGGGIVSYPETYREEVRTHIKEKLDQSVAEASAGFPIATILMGGPPHQAVDAAAEQIDADLIVLNLHGKSRVERALLGSHAERLIRTATVPVLSLPMPAIYAGHWSRA